MNPAARDESTTWTDPGLAGVRYSLPQLLREVQLERNAPAFAMEKLEQVEIAKLFQKNRPRRVLKSRK